MENSIMHNEKRKIELYAKYKKGSTDCSQTIKSKLVKETGNSSIKLPEYISFIQQNNRLLTIYIQDQVDTDGQVLNALSQNMQNDNSAFEGWAVVLKAWLPEEVMQVQLKWDVPAEKNEHYRRFCYRVSKMTDTFDWFSIAEVNQDEISEFKTKLIGLQNNCGNKIPEKKFKNGGKVGENAVEYDLVHEQDFSILMCEHYNILNIYHQLPVGVKKNGSNFFAGSKAAIDLWGMNGHELTIIELKYNNKKVGIISELFFYVCLMRDIIVGQIAMPDAVLPYEKELYSQIDKMNRVHARMLADKYHPLVDTEKVFSILNNNKFRDVTIDFAYDKYNYTPPTLRMA